MFINTNAMKQELLRVCLLLEKIHILIEKGLQQTISNSLDAETLSSNTDSPSSAKPAYPHLLDAADIRRLLNISRSTFYRMVK